MNYIVSWEWIGSANAKCMCVATLKAEWTLLYCYCWCCGCASFSNHEMCCVFRFEKRQSILKYILAYRRWTHNIYILLPYMHIQHTQMYHLHTTCTAPPVIVLPPFKCFEIVCTQNYKWEQEQKLHWMRCMLWIHRWFWNRIRIYMVNRHNTCLTGCHM